jgi:hypothetical protein
MTRDHFRAGAKAFALGDKRDSYGVTATVLERQEFRKGWDAAQDLLDVTKALDEVANEIADTVGINFGRHSLATVASPTEASATQDTNAG